MLGSILVCVRVVMLGYSSSIWEYVGSASVLTVMLGLGLVLVVVVVLGSCCTGDDLASGSRKGACWVLYRCLLWFHMKGLFFVVICIDLQWHSNVGFYINDSSVTTTTTTTVLLR